MIIKHSSGSIDSVYDKDQKKWVKKEEIKEVEKKEEVEEKVEKDDRKE